MLLAEKGLPCPSSKTFSNDFHGENKAHNKRSNKFGTVQNFSRRLLLIKLLRRRCRTTESALEADVAGCSRKRDHITDI